MDQKVFNVALSEYRALNIEGCGMLKNVTESELWWLFFAAL